MERNRLVFFLCAASFLGGLEARAQVPPPPAALTAVPADGAVSLQWPAVPEATSYYLYRSLVTDTPTGTLPPTDTPTPTPTGTLTPTDSPTPLAALPAGTVAYTDVQVTNGRHYLYQVAGLDPSGLGPAALATVVPFAPPVAVQPVTVKSLRPYALDLSWGVPNSTYAVASYRVYQFTYVTPTVPPPPPSLWALTATPIATTADTAYTDTSAVSAGVSYYYAVQAVDNQGNPGRLSGLNTDPIVPQATLPPAPPLLSGSVGLTATPGIGSYATPAASPGGYGVRLSWNGALASEGVTAYGLFRDQTPIATLVYGTPTPTLVFDDTTIPLSASLAVSTGYSLVASNGVGAVTSNTVLENITQARMGLVAVTPDATANAVTLAWAPGREGTYGLGGYWIFKSPLGPNPGSPTPVPTGSPTATPTWTPTPFATLVATPSATASVTFVDEPVANADGLGYWVVPFDATGHGAALIPPSFLRLAPTPVSNVQAAGPSGNNAVTVTWSAGGPGYYGGPQVYVLYREDILTRTPTPVATVPATQTQATDYVVATPGTPVAYLVRAQDDRGNLSDFSPASAAVLPVSLTLPAVPVVLPVTGSAVALRFAWLENPLPDAVDHYSLFGPDWPGAAPSPTPLATLLPSPTMVYSAPATAWDASVYYLQAHNSQGDSQAATLGGIPVDAVRVSAAVTPGMRQVEVSWTLVPTPGSTPAIDGYGLYRSLTPGAGFTLLNTVGAPGSSYSDASAAAGNTYYYRITARSGGLAESPLYPTMTPQPEASASTWPNVPSGLTALSDSATQITLDWAANSPAEAVQSYSLLQNGVTIATVSATQSPTPTYAVAVNQAPGTAYGYQVVAQNAQGFSDASAALSQLAPPAVTFTVTLAPPPYFSPTPSATSTVPPVVWISGLAYPAVVGGYTLYRQTQATPSVTPSYIAVGSASSPASFIVDNQPDPGYVNHYQVGANNGLGLNADPSVSAQLAVTLWPNPPVMALNADASAVTLAWATPVGNDVPITGYTIYRGVYLTTTPTVLPTVYATAVPPTADFVDPDVTPGAGYVYWMDAQNSSGGSTLSAPQTIIPVQPPTLAVTPLDSRNLLTWSPVSLATPGLLSGYVVYRAPVPTPGMTPSFVPIVSLVEGLSNTAYADTGVLDGVTYIYEVAPSSRNSIRGPFSNAVTQSVAPQPPETLAAVSGVDSLGTPYAQLRWSYTGLPTDTFFLQRKLGTEPDSSFRTVKGGVQGLDYLDSGLENKTFYDYRIYTVNAAGVTSAGFASAVALPAAPPILSSAAVTLTQNNSNAQIVIGNGLSWEGADQAGFDPTRMYPLGGYHVFRSSDGGAVYQALGDVPATFVGGVPASPVSYFDQVPLINGSAYTYLVQAFDNPPDAPVSLAHVASYQTAQAFPISPNTALDRNAIRPYGAPNEQVVNIRFVVSGPGKVNIKVYTLSGTFVRELVNQSYPQQGIYWTQWDARNMNGSLVASGVYLITTESPGGHQEFEKVAVIK